MCVLVPFQYQLEASFLEIYNETLRDLLAPPTSPSSSNQDSKLEIRMDPLKSNEVFVTNLTTVPVTSETQVLWVWPGRRGWGGGRWGRYAGLTFHIYEGGGGEESSFVAKETFT